MKKILFLLCILGCALTYSMLPIKELTIHIDDSSSEEDLSSFTDESEEDNIVIDSIISEIIHNFLTNKNYLDQNIKKHLSN